MFQLLFFDFVTLFFQVGITCLFVNVINMVPTIKYYTGLDTLAGAGWVLRRLTP